MKSPPEPRKTARCDNALIIRKLPQQHKYWLLQPFIQSIKGWRSQYYNFSNKHSDTFGNPKKLH